MKNTRLFSGTTAGLIESSRTFHALFVSNLTDFTAFDPQLDAAFATRWKDLTDQASGSVSDGIIRSRQTQFTASVEDEMQKARLKYKELKYFAAKAFPDDPEILNELGATGYDRARRSQALMITFMDELFVAANKYKTQLLQAGYTEPLIQGIRDAKEALENSNTQQEVYIKARPVATAQRTDLLNACYKTMSQVLNAAQVIYYNDPVKAGQYVFGNIRGRSDVEVIEGTVAPGSRRDVFTRPFDPERELIIRNNGVQMLMFYFCNEIPTPLGTPVNLMPDNEMRVTASQLGTEGNIFAVYNANNELSGDYEVEIS